MANYSEVKRILISHKPQPNAVLLRWLNPLNNWECWLFAGKKSKGLQTEGTVSFRAPDYRRTLVARREGYETMLLRTSIPNKRWAKGIRHLFLSPLVHAVIEGEEIPVTLPELSPELWNEAVKHGSLEVEIILNRINSLTQ